jgi:hypothetical protein
MNNEPIKKILSQKAQQLRTIIDTNNFENVIYFITVKDDNKEITKKIIVE